MFHLPRKSARALILMICVFIALDLLVLGLNLWLSKRIEEDTLEVNVAGRQRMLTQAISKSTYQWIDELTRQEANNQTVEVLFDNAALFESTLYAFRHGGTILGTEKQRSEIRPVTTASQREILKQADNLWQKWKEKLNAASLAAQQRYRNENSTQFHQHNKQTTNVLSPFLDLETFTRENNEALLALMNQLTSTLEQNAKDDVRQIRFYQTLAFCLALLNFAVIIKQFFSHLALAKESRQVLENIMHSVKASIIIADDSQRIINANKTAEDYFQAVESSLQDKQVHALIEPFRDDCYQININPDTTKFARLFQQSLMINEQKYIIYTLSDMTDQIEKESVLSKLAFIDQLTQLANRKMIESQLSQQMTETKELHSNLALLYLDLDGFKEVNDLYGHDVGDELLKNVAQVLIQNTTDIGSAGRLGGDEFLIIYPNIDKESVIKTAESILSQIMEIKQLSDRPIDVSASIGIAFYPDDAKDEIQLIKMADKAMYAAKDRGKNQLYLASPL